MTGGIPALRDQTVVESLSDSGSPYLITYGEFDTVFTEQGRLMYKISLLRLAQRELVRLPVGIQAVLIKAMDELEACGHELREPYVRDMGQGLKELRVSAKEGIGRGFFFCHLHRQVYIIHLLQKKHRKPQDGH